MALGPVLLGLAGGAATLYLGRRRRRLAAALGPRGHLSGAAWLTVHVPVAIDPAIAVRPESLRERLGLAGEGKIVPSAETAWARVNDLRTRDHFFDGKIDVRGPRHETTALLTHEVRQRLLELVDGAGAVLRQGELVLEVSPFQPGAEQRVRRAMELADRLEASWRRGMRAGLAEMALSDPLTSVRGLALGTLHEKHPNCPEVQDAARAILALGRAAVDKWTRMGAVDLLPPEEREACHRRMFEDPGEDEELRSRVLARRARQSPEGEALCLEWLRRDHPYMAWEAIKALRESLGTRRAVEPLLALEGWDFTVDEVHLGRRTLGWLAVHAARQIQARLEGAEAGQISLAPEALGGALSVPAAGQAKKEPA